MTRDDLEPFFVGTFHVTDDIQTYVNTDVPWMAWTGPESALTHDSDIDNSQEATRWATPRTARTRSS